jgi:DNA polymerase I-like protein with 3'-5' exonuclease and polymerase domains
VLTALSPVLSGFNGLDIQIVNDLTTTPKVQGAVVILALGNDPKLLMETMKVVPKGRTTTSLRGSYFGHETFGCPIMFSYAPGIVDMDYGKYVDLLTDVGTACRFAKTGSKSPVLGEYKYVDDFKEVNARVDALFAETGKPVESTLDLETVGLDPYLLPKDDHPGAYIVTVQVSVEPGKSYVKRFDSRKAEEAGLSDMEFLEQLGWFLNTPKVSLGGANLKFDLHWVAVRARLECTNFKFDTTLVGSLLDENRSNGLDVHVKIYAPELGGYSDEFDRQIDKSRMDLVPPETLLPYAGGDTDGCLRVRKVMKQDLLKTPALAGFYVNILHPAARAFEMVERGGVLVDMDAYKELETDLLGELDTLTTKAKSIMGGRLVAKHHDPDKRGGLNLTKASLLVDFMFSPMGLNLKPKMTTEKTGAPSTSLDHLMMFKEVPEATEFVALLKDFSSATKTLATYVYGFQKHIRSDGRFHPSYYFFAGNKDEGEGGTNTGRLSCRDPAFQTIPKHTKWAKKLRKCFPAPPGMLVLENDYSQGELRVIACIANDETMIEAYARGMDLHVITSGRFAGYSYEEMLALKKTNKEMFDRIRQLGKAGNFGLIYGMGTEGFQSYAELNYGVKLSFEEADKFRSGFFETYYRLPEYHKTYKAFARKHGYVTSPLGRVRHLPLINSVKREVQAGAERQAINSPVQSCLSDMMIWAIAISHQQGWFKEAPCFGAIHDAKYVYIPEDNYEFYVKRELELMESLPFEKVGWKPQLKFVADAKIGRNMAELREFDRK